MKQHIRLLIWGGETYKWQHIAFGLFFPIAITLILMAIEAMMG